MPNDKSEMKQIHVHRTLYDNLDGVKPAVIVSTGKPKPKMPDVLAFLYSYWRAKEGLDRENGL